MEGLPDPSADVKRKRYVVRPPTMPNGIGIKLARSKSKLKERVGSRLTRQDSAGKFVNAAEDAVSVKQSELERDAEEPFQFEDATDDEAAHVGPHEESTTTPSGVDGSYFHTVSPSSGPNPIREEEEGGKQLTSSTSTSPSLAIENEAHSPDVHVVSESRTSASVLEISHPNELAASSGKKGTECASHESSSDTVEQKDVSPGRLESSLSARDYANDDSASDGSAQNDSISWSGRVTELMASLDEIKDGDEEIALSGWLVEMLACGASKTSSVAASTFRFVLFFVMLPLRLYLRSVGIRARRWGQVSSVKEEGSPQEGTARGILADGLDVHDSPVAESAASSQHDGSLANATETSAASERETTEHLSKHFSSDYREEREGRDHSGHKLSEMSTELKRSFKRTLSKGRLSRKGSSRGSKRSPQESADEAGILESSPVSGTSFETVLNAVEQNETRGVSEDAAAKAVDDAKQTPAEDPAGDNTAAGSVTEVIGKRIESDQNARGLEPRTKSIVREPTFGTRSGSSYDVRFNRDSYSNNDVGQNLSNDRHQIPNVNPPLVTQEDNNRSRSNGHVLDDSPISADPPALMPAKSAQRDDYDEYETTTDDGREHKEKILSDERSALHRKNSAASPTVAQVSDKLNHVKNAPKALLRSLGGLRRSAEDTRFASARSARKTAMLLTDILTNEMGAVCSTRRGTFRLLATKDFDVTSRLSTKINIDPLDDYSCNVTFMRERGDKSGNDAFVSFVSDAHCRFVAHTTQGKPTVF